MTVEIVDSSPQAVELSKKREPSSMRKDQKYPFGELDVGKSFRLPLADANLNSLQVLCSRKSVGGKRFIVVKHETIGFVEVARLA